jgi:hypothetical protein
MDEYGVYRDLAAELAYNLGKMEQLSKTTALKLLSNWERQNQPISVFCFSSAIALSSKNGRVAMCLDDQKPVISQCRFWNSV